MTNERNMKTPQERLTNIGAMVLVFANGDGSYGICSLDKSCEGWGNTLDQAWGRYLKKARRITKKREEAIAQLAKRSQEKASGGQLEPSAGFFEV